LNGAILEEEPPRLWNRYISGLFVVAKNSGGVRYFFFLNQPIMNKIPMRNAGPAIMRDHDSMYHSIGFDVIILIILIPLYNNPARIKAIPPTISCFQETNRTINKINDGILCITNPKIVCQNPRFISKTSSEKRARKRMNSIDKILGVQYTNLLIFLSIFLIK
jgi:hypothetical protein